MDRKTGQIDNLHQQCKGLAPDGSAGEVSLSDDGRFVAYNSSATNLTEDEGKKGGLFLHDRETGTTRRLFADANMPCFAPRLSSDGKTLSFRSEARNILPDGIGGHCHCYVHDLETGVTERVSQRSDGQLGQGWVQEHSLSADGKHIAFTYTGYNLDPTMKVEKDSLYSSMEPITTQVYVHDRETHETRVVSRDAAGMSDQKNCVAPAISADGQRVVYSGPGGIFEAVGREPAKCLDQEGSNPTQSANGRCTAWTNKEGEIVLQNPKGEQLSVTRPDRSSLLRWNRCVHPVLCSEGKSVAFVVNEENPDRHAGMTGQLYTFDFARWERALDWSLEDKPLAPQGVQFTNPNEVIVGGVRLKRRQLCS
jgi:Tol biopolymer transport system component